MNIADLSGIVSSSRKPNMMQFLFKLTEEIDCEVMHNAMQKALRRYPYFVFRIIKTDSGYDKVENQLPVVVMDSFDKDLKWLYSGLSNWEGWTLLLLYGYEYLIKTQKNSPTRI